jgi:glycosyltransferase involved in cell wall biosynthesis
MVELIQCLGQREVEIEVLAPSFRGQKDHTVHGIRTHRFRYAPAHWETLTHESGAPNKIRANPLYLLLLPGYLFCGCLATWRICRRQRYDVIHVHWPLPQGLLGLVGRRAGGPHLVSTFYGADLALLNRFGWLRPLLQRIVAASTAVIAISSYTARELEAQAGIRPLVIPYGIDMTPVAGPPSLPGPPGSQQMVLSVGRLIERKGYPVLIQALAQIAARRDDVHLNIVGEGQERTRLEALIEELGLAGRVTLLGRVSDEELARQYATCSLFVLPAIVDRGGDTEGLGMVLLEALRYSKPVLASQVGGIPDIVEDEVSGLLVPPGDPEALAVAIERLLDDPALAHRLAERGYAVNRERFAWEQVVDAYLEVYRRCRRVR